MTNADSTLLSFENPLEETIQQAWAVGATVVHLTALSEGASKLNDAIAKVGGESFAALNDVKTTTDIKELLPHYIIDFIWADRVKSFFILWRDVLFQQQKAHILFLENKTTRAALKELNDKSKEVVASAAGELKSLLEDEIKSINRTKNGIEKNIGKWKLQENPWPIYKEQINKLADQCRELNQQYIALKALIGEYAGIKKIIKGEINFCKNAIQNIKTSSQEAVAYIENNITEKPGSIPGFLESVEGNLNIRNHLQIFTEAYEKKLEVLPEKVRATVAAADGILHFKEIFFKKNTRQWLESEIKPLFYEIWELTDNVVYGMKMSLVNIRNRVIMAVNENKEGGELKLEKGDASQPLHAFLKKENNWENNFTELEKLINARLSGQFSISNIYQLNNEFLPLPLEYTMSQIGIDQNKLIDKSKEWLGRITGRVEEIKTSVAQEELMSISEQVVRYVQSRKGDETNNQYASIFLTKGYLGESFWVGRQNEIRHIENIVEQWRLGYRGAVALSGTRFCGKSIFGELVANRYFPENTIRVFPNNILNIKGRKLETGHDLGKALDFIRKNTLQERPLIWIDDLEAWNGNGISLHANVRQLKKHIDNYAGQKFYMVALGNWTKAHLDRIFEINKIFQTEIHLDRMSQAEIHKAILIRHGATHKTLVDENGEEISPQAFNKLISKIYKSESGNIGDALNQWAFSTKKINEETVTHIGAPNYLLPDFISPDAAVILAAIMMEKRTSEYRLRKIFGPAFTEKYASILKRLLSVGILSRQLDGWLELNEVAANETGRLLGRKSILKFN